jgi:hypothetical protein
MKEKTKYYFEDGNSEICYQKDYFLDSMRFDGFTEIEVYEAIPERRTDAFWCKNHWFCGDDSKDTCGKQCKQYSPRNGKSGCCKSYTTRLFYHGEKITLKLC